MFGLSLKSKVTFFRQLATLIESGMPLMACIESLKTIRDPGTQRIVKEAETTVSQGLPLSTAFEKFPGDFEEYIVQMIKAGEVGGTLDRRLKELADHLENLQKIKMGLLVKLIYPILLFHAGIFIPPLVVWFLQGFAAYARVTLIPLFIIYAVVSGSYAGYQLAKKAPPIARTIDSILIGFPFIGKFFRYRAAYRFMLVMGDMMEAGINLGLAIESSASACGNAAAASRFNEMREKVIQGIPLSVCFRNTGLFPETSLSIIESGEKSGTLAGSIKKAAELLKQDLDNATNIVFIVIPVVMYLGVAGYIGYVIVTTFINQVAPLYNQF